MTQRVEARIQAAREKNRKELTKQRALLERSDASAAAIISHLHKLDSPKRLEGLVSILQGRPAAIFWEVFLEVWSKCDNTGVHRSGLLALLKQATAEVPSLTYLDKKNRAFYDGLPAEVTIYRGCSLDQIDGLSWSVDPKVAMDFAQGHRGIRVHRPVLVTARTKKGSIFSVCDDRREREVICVPTKILRVDHFNPRQTQESADPSNKPLC